MNKTIKLGGKQLSIGDYTDRRVPATYGLMLTRHDYWQLAWHWGLREFYLALEDYEAPLEERLAQMVNNQVAPQLAAKGLRERGIPVETAFVSTNPEAEGWELTCLDCGRTAKLSFDPGRKVGLCPSCQRRRGF